MTTSLVDTGIVYLVGAGPGDPRLLTVRAVELIQSADVIAYDELISASILATLPIGVERLPVGRRQGTGRPPYRLHPAVLERAEAGKRVVRLKQGDPLIFGRGGEEAQELRERGIPFEIVPGITSALGAAAYAGIPLTHRQVSSEATLATGHDLQGPNGESPDPAARRSTAGTLVLFMASRRMPGNITGLLQNGYSASTPCAYVAAATTGKQKVVTGTLENLVARTRALGVDPAAPALLIVGEVVRLRDEVAWFDRKPLFGKTILVGRARPGPSRIAAQLRENGAEVVEAPLVDATPIVDAEHIRRALGKGTGKPTVIVASSTDVSAIFDVMSADEMDVVSVGPDALSALSARSIKPVLATDGAREESLAADGLNGKRVTLIASTEDRTNLEAALRKIGALVETFEPYRYEYEWPLMHERLAFDLVVLPSSSAAKAVLTSARGPSLRAVPTVVMGPQTEAAARDAGAENMTVVPDDAMAPLVQAALSALAGAAGRGT